MNYRFSPTRDAGPALDEALPSGGREATEPAAVSELRRNLLTLWRHRWTLGIVIAVCLAVGFAIARATPPVFTATSSVMLNTRETNVVQIESVLSGLSRDFAAVAGEIEVIRSYKLLERVVDKLRLELDRELNPPDNAAPGAATGTGEGGVLALLPESLRLRLGIAEPAMPDLPQAVAGADVDRVGTVERLHDMLHVAQVGSYAPVIQISVTSVDPDKAMLLADAVAEQYLVDQLEAKFDATRRATAWLSARVADLKEKVERSESAVAAYRARMSAGHGQGIELIEKQMAELSSQLVDARAARAEAAAELAQLRSAEAAAPAGSGAAEPRPASVEQLRARRAELLTRERQLPAGDPAIAELRAEMATLDRAIASQSRRAAEGVRIRRGIETVSDDLAAARAREEALEASLKELEQRSLGQSGEAIQLRQLEREAEASRLIYETFLNRLKETSEQADLQQADARLISPAQSAAFTGTSTKGVLARAFGIGLLLGIAAVYLLERLNNTFRTASEVEEATGAPVLSSLPRAGRWARRAQVLDHIREKPLSSLTEGVRNLRTALLLSSIDAPPRVVMLTSSLAGEGKSTTALLLAYMSVQMGRSAIVVDCDIRRPTLAGTFRLQGGDDLVSVLDRSADLDDAIHLDRQVGVHVLPTRTSVPQAADILSSRRFAELVEELSSRFDLVVLDAPPVLLVSDALAIGMQADATVYAIQWDRTPREAARKGLKQLRDFGIKVNGTVLTLVNRRAEAEYSAYRYGYGTYQNKYYSD